MRIVGGERLLEGLLDVRQLVAGLDFGVQLSCCPHQGQQRALHVLCALRQEDVEKQGAALALEARGDVQSAHGLFDQLIGDRSRLRRACCERHGLVLTLRPAPRRPVIAATHNMGFSFVVGTRQADREPTPPW